MHKVFAVILVKDIKALKKNEGNLSGVSVHLQDDWSPVPSLGFYSFSLPISQGNERARETLC